MMRAVLLLAALALPASASEPAEGERLGAGQMFTQLYKHLEPHPVAALWIGGSRGVDLFDPHVPGGEHAEGHGAPVFHSSAELTEHYREELGGGRGILIYNINTVQWIAGVLLVLLLGWAGMRARRVGAGAPKGALYHVLESVVLFVRDKMVYDVMGEHHGRRFVPLFLTQFFFILLLNIFGLIPDFTHGLLGTATANLAVTGALAFTTLIWIHLSGIREHGFFRHWKNFVPQVPVFVLPIIVPVEIIGMLVKPVALTVRLFANMLAGHLVILSFFGLAYFFGTWLIAPVPLAMAIGISCLELFVAFLQAYVFTYLSIIFVGAAVHPEH